MKRLYRMRVFILCWITYVCAYVCRINISIALPYMKEAFPGGAGLMGIIGSVFFAVYGAGQLVNGLLGDRLSPRRMVSAALIGTALMNLLIGLSDNVLIIAICWGVNGYFQSMFWGPLMRLLSGLTPQSARRKVSAGMSSTMVLGYALTWAVLGRVVLYTGWRWLFLIPSAVGCCMLAVWLLFLRVHVDFLPARQKSSRNPLRFISRRKLWFLVLACCFMGVVKEGISLWAPLLFSEAIGYTLSDSLNVLLVLPLANFCGIFAAVGLHKRFARSDLAPVLMMCSVILACALAISLADGFSATATIILIAIISAMSFGCNTIFMSMIPLRYTAENMVSSIAGILDFSTYVGAAVSSAATGFIVSSAGWNRVPFIWLAAGGIALVLLFLQDRIEHI